jgi:hypothetical protein
MSAPISWPELIVLMAFGARGGRTTDESLRGTWHSREVWPVHDEDEPDEGERTEVHPTLGRLRVAESTVRVARRGRLVRVERPDGQPTIIFGAGTTWCFDGEADRPTAYDRTRAQFGWSGARFVQRPALSRWEGDDFTSLTGPIEATEVLGRPAWAFELAPPARKPYPMQMVVDVETGIVLRVGNRDFGSVDEWIELDLDVDLPAALFEWTGPTRVRSDDAEHERDMTERRKWLETRGVTPLLLEVEAEVMLHEWDDSGTMYASLDFHTYGTLLRRHRSADDWPEVDRLHHDSTYRWSDARWDWCLATTPALDETGLARIRDRLARTS